MSKKLISLLLTVVLFTTAVLSVYADAENNSVADSAIDAIKKKGAKTEDTVAEDNGKQDSDGEDSDSGQWEEYAGDIEAFVYGLIIRQLECSFDVFTACLDLSDGNTVYGIAYTDYSNCYTNQDENLCCFEAGFLPFYGELPIPQKDFDSGLILYNLDYSDDRTSFLWVYGSDPFSQHCVVYNQYLIYGVDDSGTIFYDATEYVPGVCDESIGSLYSYDEAKYLFDIDVGTYLKIAGVSLFSQMDYDELEKEINRIIQT